MRLFLLIIPFLTVLMAPSCSKKEKDVELREGTVQIALTRCSNGDIGGNDLRLCFDSLLADSRCPANAMCVWAGSAVAKFTFIKNGESVSFPLATLKYGDYVEDTVLLGYKIELVTVHPYPGTVPMPVPADQIKAEVKITKQ